MADELGDLLVDLLVLERVRVVVVAVALEGAEDALGGADVGVVDVAVDDVGADRVAVDAAAAGVGARGYCGQQAGVPGFKMGKLRQRLVDRGHGLLLGPGPYFQRILKIVRHERPDFQPNGSDSCPAWRKPILFRRI
jgi:hypothetical protein